MHVHVCTVVATLYYNRHAIKRQLPGYNDYLLKFVLMYLL